MYVYRHVIYTYICIRIIFIYIYLYINIYIYIYIYYILILFITQRSVKYHEPPSKFDDFYLLNSTNMTKNEFSTNLVHTVSRRLIQNYTFLKYTYKYQAQLFGW